MKSSHKKTLKAIFAEPLAGPINWNDIEALFLSVGVRISNRKGSRVSFIFNNHKAIFHRPHPSKETKKYQIKDARIFLEKIGVIP
ncbi:MAG: type II toxin-antitoxin system HicA family toxin [Deltaproteobacteria bacterium]|jgi:hypothetical protein|nr:type II toxin-antitoxin system HicA family toxin [Deltaproteobacteria bacterium]